MIGLTGARGVLGRRLVEAFAARGAVISAYPGDVCDVTALSEWARDCTRIIHAAAVVPTGQVSADPGAAITVNVAGTANVAAAAAEAKASFSYVSTSHVYASSDTPLTEAERLEPVSLYGLTKLQGEQWVRRLTDDPLIVRIFSYFDSRQAPTYLVPALHDRIRKAPQGGELPLFGFRSRRDIADARWLAEQLAQLVLSGATGTLNLGTGDGTPIAAVAERLAAAAGRSDIRWVPADDHPGDTLVADPAMLAKSGVDARFDLDSALRAFVAEAA